MIIIYSQALPRYLKRQPIMLLSLSGGALKREPSTLPGRIVSGLNRTRRVVQDRDVSFTKNRVFCGEKI